MVHHGFEFSFSLDRARIMARSIKLFRYVQYYYKTLSIYPSHLCQSCSINFRNICVFSSMVFIATTTFSYALFEAAELEERGRSLTAFFSSVLFIEFFVVNFLKMSKIRKLIENFEIFIESSKQPLF